MNSNLNPFLFIKHYFRPPTFLGLKKVGWVYQFRFTLAFPTSNKTQSIGVFCCCYFFLVFFFFSISTVHKLRCSSGKAQEKAPRLHLEDMQGLATHSHSAQSKWKLGMLPTCPTEWFRGVFPSRKPASQQLLGDTRKDADQHTRERGPREPAMQKDCWRNWTSSHTVNTECPTVLQQGQ